MNAIVSIPISCKSPKTLELPFKGILRTAASREVGQCQGRKKPMKPLQSQALASGFWSMCLLRRVKTSTISGTLFVPLDFPHLFSQSISS